MAPFAKDLHSHRERMVFLADPQLLDETINLKGRRRKDFFRLIHNVRGMVNLCPLGTCHIGLLVVPHKVQVSREHARQYELLGATFADKDALMEINYPFVRELQAFLSDRANLLVINPLAKIQDMEHKGTKCNDPIKLGRFRAFLTSLAWWHVVVAAIASRTPLASSSPGRSGCACADRPHLILLC
jgi:hypothetical protein